MSTSNPINSYSFFLNSTGNNFTNGGSWTIPLPSNISVSNPANSFSAVITEASIPQTPFIISDQIKNNVFQFKLQVFVDKFEQLSDPAPGTVLQTTNIGEWMDCTDFQRRYLEQYNSFAGFGVNAFASSGGEPPGYYTGPKEWCGFDANTVTVPNGIYTTNVDFINAVNTGLASAQTLLNNRFNAVYHYYGIGFPPPGSANFTFNIVSSGVDKSQMTISMSNMWCVQVNLFSTRNIYYFTKYRLYVKANEIFSMLGFTDRDETFNFADLIPGQYQVGLEGYNPNFLSQLNSVLYISPNVVVLNPNVNYYIAILNLSQTKSFVAIDGSAVTSQTFCSLFRSSSLPRSEVYYSLPTVIQIQDKNFNFLELCIKDYRNRIIPTVLFSSPVYITIVFQENLGNQSTPAINLQQLNDIDAVFWRQKELELQFELESFIRTKRN